MTALILATRLRRLGLDFNAACVILYIPPGGSSTPGTLAKALRIKRSCTTRILNRLERARLIRRRTDFHDRRCVRVELTKAGVDMRKIIDKP